MRWRGKFPEPIKGALLQIIKKGVFISLGAGRPKKEKEVAQ
jgi:hypothetical protein